MSDSQSRQPGDRPKNHEVENEMIKPPAAKGKPPRAATDPHGSDKATGRGKDGPPPPGNIHEVEDRRGTS